MSTVNKKTITIPTNVGSNNLSETFGKISFSNEVKEFLSALEAEISVRYIPGGDKPIIAIVSKTGKTVCTLDEFKALSGYRRWINDVLKEAERLTSTSEKVKLTTFFLEQYKDQGKSAPDVILEQNQTKFNQVGSSLQVVYHNLDVIMETMDNKWRGYITDHASAIIRILYSCQAACMGSTIVDKTFIDEGLFKAHVPKWLYMKLIDKNFTSNLKRDSFSLLFPKGNFLKAIALTTKEIQDENFCKSNHEVLQLSGGIIALSKVDFSALYPHHSTELEEPVKEFLATYQWVCTSPLPVDELLALRETGKNVPVIREAQPPKQTGKNQRPENELAKVKRQITNILNRIQGVWNSAMQLSVPVSDPLTEFWDLSFKVASWNVTPTNSVYNCIRAVVDHQDTLTRLRETPNEDQLRRIALIACQGLRIPAGTAHAKGVVNAFETIKTNKYTDRANAPDISNEYFLGDDSGFNPEIISSDQINETRQFLGLKTKTAKKKKKAGGSSVRLSVKVLKVLEPLKRENPAVYEDVVGWLMSTFKTGRNEEMQLLAAERVLGEALANQDKIFGEEFEEEDALGQIEEYEDEYESS